MEKEREQKEAIQDDQEMWDSGGPGWAAPKSPSYGQAGQSQ